MTTSATSRASSPEAPRRSTMVGRWFRALWADVAGAAMMEFALVAPALIAMVLAILQISLVFFAQQMLESITQKTARLLLTGSAQQGGMTKDQFKTAACANLPTFMSCSKLLVDVDITSSFSAATVSKPTITLDSSNNPTTATNYNTGGSGDIVVVRMLYLWPIQFGPLGLGASPSNYAGNQRLLMATAVFKTEPY